MDYDNAINDYNEAITLNSNFVNGYINKGVAYYDKGDYDEAIKCFSEAIKIDSEKHIAYFNKGFPYAAKEDYDNAIKYFTKAIKCFSEGKNPKPDFLEAFYERGKIFSKKGEYENAIDDFTKVINIDPNYIEAYYHGGLAYHKNGNDKATEYWEKYIDIALKGITEFRVLRNMYSLNQEYKVCTDKKFLEYEKMIIFQGHEKNKDTLKTFIDEKEPLYNNIRITEDGKEQYILYQYVRCSKETLYRLKNNHLAFTNPRDFNDPADPLIKILEKTEGKKDALLEKLDFKITCLSKNPKNILTWSHYADRHKGVCIAYNVTELIGKPEIVFEKIDFRAFIPRPREDSMLDVGNFTPTTVLDTFTIKHEDWAYEKEYRFIKISNNEYEYAPIVEIYLGKHISKKNEELVRHIVDNKVVEAGEEKIEIHNLAFGDNNVFQLEKEKI